MFPLHYRRLLEPMCKSSTFILDRIQLLSAAPAATLRTPQWEDQGGSIDGQRGVPDRSAPAGAWEAAQLCRALPQPLPYRVETLRRHRGGGKSGRRHHGRHALQAGADAGNAVGGAAHTRDPAGQERPREQQRRANDGPTTADSHRGGGRGSRSHQWWHRMQHG